MTSSDPPPDTDPMTVAAAPHLVPDDGPVDPDSPRPVASPKIGRWPHRRRRSRRRRRDVLVVVGAGGAIGTLGRYALSTTLPEAATGFPWTTLCINVGGSFALGIVLYIAFERRTSNRLLRPFLAIGLIGGFTTFSTFAVEAAQRLRSAPAIAIAYILVSLAAGLSAVIAGATLIRWLYTYLESHDHA